MATVFANLPVPAADGVGASVDVTGLGPLRTISIDDGAAFEGLLFVEASCDGGVNFVPITRFDSSSQRKVTQLAGYQFARVRRTLVRPGGALPVINIGSEAAGAEVFGAMAVPAGDGVGAALNIAAGGDVLTIYAAGTFNRNIFIEGSQDGGVTFSRIDDFGKFEAARFQTTQGAFQLLRVRSTQAGGGDVPVIMAASMALATAGGGGGIINVNGVVTAALANLRSPMASIDPAGVLRIDHGNLKVLISVDPVVGINVDLNTSFFLELSSDDQLISNPVVSILATPRDGENIAFIFKSGVESPRKVLWDTKYIFASGETDGITLAAVNKAMLAIDDYLEITFRYNADNDRWYPRTLTIFGTSVPTDPVRALFDKEFYADQMLPADNVDWGDAIAIPAPLSTKGGTDDDVIVAVFDAVTPKGRGWPMKIHPQATRIRIEYWIAAETLPVAPADQVQLTWFRKQYASNVAPTTFTAIASLAEQSLPANTRFQMYEESGLLSAYGLTAGTTANIMISRVTVLANELPGNLHVWYFRIMQF